jgi:hypothetical protein
MFAKLNMERESSCARASQSSCYKQKILANIISRNSQRIPRRTSRGFKTKEKKMSSEPLAIMYYVTVFTNKVENLVWHCLPLGKSELGKSSLWILKPFGSRELGSSSSSI